MSDMLKKEKKFWPLCRRRVLCLKKLFISTALTDGETRQHNKSFFSPFVILYTDKDLHTLLNDYCSIIDVLCVFIVDVSEQTIVL